MSLETVMKMILLLAFVFSTVVNAQQRWTDNQYDNQIGPSDKATTPTCFQTTPSFSPDSVGPFHIGISVEQVETLCHSLRFGWYGGDEGIFEPVALLKFGSGSILLEFDDTLITSRVRRMFIGTPEIRSPEGLGVGSLVKDLAAKWGKPSRAEIECLLYVYFKSKPGISFQVDLPVQRDCGQLENVDEAILSQSKVRQVLIIAKR